MRKAIDEEFERIIKKIDDTDYEIQQQLDNFKDQIAITFAKLRGDINGDEPATSGKGDKQ